MNAEDEQKAIAIQATLAAMPEMERGQKGFACSVVGGHTFIFFFSHATNPAEFSEYVLAAGLPDIETLAAAVHFWISTGRVEKQLAVSMFQTHAFSASVRQVVRAMGGMLSGGSC